jgi:transposase InsO family protein
MNPSLALTGYNAALHILIRLFLTSHAALIAENLFLRKQLALFQEREVKPRRTTPVSRLALLALGRFFDWRSALVIVTPETFVKWHRTAFRMFWSWKSHKRGRPAIPCTLRKLIRRLDRENPTWGEQKIADELLLKFGIRVSARTVHKYLEGRPLSSGRKDQRWSTFVRNHARGIVACDFLITVTASFRILYVFVAMEVGSRRILHTNVTEHPTTEWTTQQFREFLAYDHPYQFVIHDRDAIFSASLDEALRGFGIRPIRTPRRAPMANAYCERLIGTIRRVCLDYLIPFNERHVRGIVKELTRYYNRGRPHSALGPGIPESQATPPASVHRHRLPIGYRVISTPVLGGLHHEYGLEKEAA